VSLSRLRFLSLAFIISTNVSAQAVSGPGRIHERIDSGVPFVLRNHLAPQAKAQYDRGPVDPRFTLYDLSLLFKPSPQQQAELDQFLVDVQNPASGIYHHWLTPEQYADRFAVSLSEMNQIAAWLAAQGFQVSYQARARNWIEFSGTAAQVETTFRTPIHRYLIDGEEHYANLAEPSIPAALEGVVSALRGLDDFRLKPMHHRRSVARALQPDFDTGGVHFLAPDDFAAIYDLNPLYNAGIDGTGQKLAVVGQTDIVLSDIAAFRSIFNLPPNVPQLVLHGRDPGTNSGDQTEAELDIEWSGAVARNTTIVYVYSTNVSNSLVYAVDQNLAPVITMSYGACEAENTGVLQTYRNTAQQAAAQGISWLAASGDNGAADCDSSSPSTHGLAVEFPASIPEVTAVGGTTFNEGTGTYWSTTNGANQGSALGYIPEMAWNDTPLAATGGGTSLYFPAPSYQTGAGFPNTGFRDLPDVSLSASFQHDGYMMCVVPTNCPSNWTALGEGTGYLVVGGTSVSVQAFGGILALVNHYLTARGFQSAAGVGSANQTLYWLAQNSPSAFHDVTTGNNIVPCRIGTTDCTGGSLGFSATSGYDRATGLGTVDAYILASAWGAATAPQITSISPSSPGVSAGTQTLQVSGSGFQSGLTSTVITPSGAAATAAVSNLTSNGFQVNVALNVTGAWQISVVNADGRPSNSFSFTVTSQSLPVATVSSATSITSSRAVLNGTVTPNGTSAQAWFVYGTSNVLNGAAATAAQSVGSGSNSVPVSATLTGLTAGTTYYYQTVASNTVGTSRSAILSFTTTAAALPVVTTVAASSIGNSSAVLGASVNPNGIDTQVWFIYGTNSSLTGAAATPAQDIGSGSSAVTVNATLTGLASGTTYYFLAIASNSTGTVEGSTLSFISSGNTSPVPATPGGLSPAYGATGIPTSPTLSWSPSLNATGYTVYFGLTNPPAGSVTLSGANNTSFSPGIYTGGQPFYWQVVATNGSGSASSPLMQFTMGTLAMLGTKVGVFRNNVQVLEDTNGNGMYDPGVDRFITDFSGPGGFIAGDIPVAGDWTGDGHAKVGIYRSSTGTWYLDANNDGAYDSGDYTYQYGGLAGDTPVVGNWNNIAGISTHKDCIGLFRPGGFWLLDLNCNGSYEGTPNDAFFPFGGLSGDVPVVGNWTGGTTRVGVVRKYAPAGVPIGEPFFWVLDAADVTAGSAVATHQPAPGSFAFGGLPGDVFITGDWNNGGAAKAGIFRAGAAGAQPFQWVLDANGRHTADLVFNLYGLAGDTGILGRW
jgi:hypothetical protein